MRKFIVTESEREQIKGLYEQPVQSQPVTDETILGMSPSKLGLKPGQIMKDKTGVEVARVFAGMSPNSGHTITITLGNDYAKVFNPEDNTTKNVPMDQLRKEYKQRMVDYLQNMTKKINTSPADTKYMSDDDVAKLSASLKQKQ